MAFNKQSDALTIREIEYSIRIKDKDKGFHELLDLLRAELTRFEDERNKGDSQHNAIRDFLQSNIDRSIVIRDNTRVYFLNYKEHGSFLIEFTLLVITRYTNYGTTRLALDYLIKDTIGEYFEELLERHIPVSVAISSTDNELYEIDGSLQNKNKGKFRNINNYLPVILSAIALLTSLTIVILWFFQKKQIF